MATAPRRRRGRSTNLGVTVSLASNSCCQTPSSAMPPNVSMKSTILCAAFLPPVLSCLFRVSNAPQHGLMATNSEASAAGSFENSASQRSYSVPCSLKRVPTMGAAPDSAHVKPACDFANAQRGHMRVVKTGVAAANKPRPTLIARYCASSHARKRIRARQAKAQASGGMSLSSDQKKRNALFVHFDASFNADEKVYVGILQLPTLHVVLQIRHLA
eukprot:7257361-Prymnesium_polylepis.1